MRCPRFALILYRNRRTNPVWGHLIRPFGALTGACRPGLAENSTLDCFPGAAALLKGKAFGGRHIAAPTTGRERTFRRNAAQKKIHRGKLWDQGEAPSQSFGHLSPSTVPRFNPLD